VETARAQIIAANAAVQSAKATAETAQINLGFTRLTSPIDGIPGIAQQQVGALVSPASPTITTVSTLDPIKVYFTVSEQEYLDFHRRYSTPATLDAERKGLRLELILADGTVYPHSGTSTLRIARSTSGPAPSGWRDCSRIRETTCGPANTAGFARRCKCSPARCWCRTRRQ
jgi:multidrug efflux pump subunit AcrA (membrane-fusion protein)